MSHKRARETRVTVSLKARLKSDMGWGDSQICNVSSRGMMVRHIPPPPLGSYVEVCRGPFSIVGRVRWIAGDRFGVQSLEDIDLDELKSPGREPTGPVSDRRSRVRPAAGQMAQVPDFWARLEASNRLARQLQFLAMALGGMTVALILTQLIAASLSAPLAKVASALPI
ncbi:PilZ domain-containing protein [Tsuneonella rigui]|jgi:hypothetical protein|uniref:PilZ domain-containing protein n=1 Tax=Tsuneonella rigui TaxID=1708790 RepID=UPI000F7E069D|nr:PilZ domain-containing protein [Tsuneonella rigui]